MALNAEVFGKLEEINRKTSKIGEGMREVATGPERQSPGIGPLTSALEDPNLMTRQISAGGPGIGDVYRARGWATIAVIGVAREGRVP